MFQGGFQGEGNRAVSALNDLLYPQPALESTDVLLRAPPVPNEFPLVSPRIFSSDRHSDAQDTHGVQELINDIREMQRRMDDIESRLGAAVSATTASSDLIAQVKNEVLSSGVTNDIVAQVKKEMLKESPDLKQEPAAVETFVEEDHAPKADLQSPEKIDLQAPEYAFEESIWDLVLFFGHDKVGACGSVLIGIQFLLILTMQIAFCIVCQINFTSNDFDEDTQQGLKDFRLRFGHDMQYSDTGLQWPLARIICSDEVSAKTKSNSLIYGTSQMTTLDAIDSYLEADSTLESMFGGRTLCALALACWFLTVFKHFQRIWRCLFALSGVPKGTSTVIAEEGGCFVLESLAWPRIILACFVSIVRFGCYGFLLYSGGAWLSYTTDAKDLVLNAAALEFVLDLDGLLFQALAPVASKIFISQLQPLPERGWLFCRGADSIALLGIIFVPTVTIYFYMDLVVPLVRDMTKARSLLCDDNLGFYFSRDIALGYYWFQLPDAETNKLNRAMSEEIQKSVESMMKTGKPRGVGTSTIYENFSVNEVATLDTSAYADLLNIGCLDGDRLEGGLLEWVNLVGRIYNLTEYWGTVTSCDAFVTTCWDADLAILDKDSYILGYAMRLLCPKSCGCEIPDSIVPDHRPSFGCPSSCFVTQKYKNKLDFLAEKYNCTDFAEHMPHWPVWAKYLDEVMMTVWKIESSYDLIVADGCTFFSRELSHGALVQVCEGTSNVIRLRPLSTLCPQTCQCSTGWVKGCAPRCLSPNSSTLPSLAPTSSSAPP